MSSNCFDQNLFSARFLSESDLSQVLIWRNSELVRSQMLNSQIISWEEHINWFKNYVLSGKVIYWIAKYNNQEVGIFYVDKINLLEQSAFWGIFVIRPGEIKGLGSAMGKFGVKLIFHHLKELKTIKAQVIKNNERSLNAHLNIGFTHKSEEFLNNKADNSIAVYNMEICRENSKFPVNCIITTEKFYLRDLSVNDANENYLRWLSDTTAKKFIEAARLTQDLDQLKNYLQDKTSKNNVRFFGIFEKISNTHIGNIKYEPINTLEEYAVMGVLIGDENWRGKGVFGEIFSASASFLGKKYNLKKIYLGVNKNNIAAVKSYEKSGFIVTENHPFKNSKNFGQVMVYQIPSDKISE